MQIHTLNSEIFDIHAVLGRLAVFHLTAKKKFTCSAFKNKLQILMALSNFLFSVLFSLQFVSQLARKKPPPPLTTCSLAIIHAMLDQECCLHCSIKLQFWFYFLVSLPAASFQFFLFCCFFAAKISIRLPSLATFRIVSHVYNYCYCGTISEFAVHTRTQIICCYMLYNHSALLTVIANVADADDVSLLSSVENVGHFQTNAGNTRVINENRKGIYENRKKNRQQHITTALES